jgi:glycine C-acetyltransferase
MSNVNVWQSLEQELEQMKKEGRYRELVVWDDRPGVWMKLGERKVLQLSSNNYLGLTGLEEATQAAKAALDRYGVGSGSVRSITGTLSIHAELEQELARFKGTEAALVFQSGFTTNQGVLSSILGSEDVVISDELNHASIIDGIRLTKAERKIYAHKDMNQLEAVLQTSKAFRQRLVVTDGVFSMDGDIAPLPAIVELAERYNAIVYVDDAHASGVLGRNGKGSTDHFGLHGRVHIQVGTLSKAIGAVGGYVAGAQVLKDYLIHKARPFLFSTSQPPSVAASCLAAIRYLAAHGELTEKLWRNADYFRHKLKNIGFDTGLSETPIIPIITGSPARTMAFSDRLLSAGIFSQGIVYPTVAMDKGRVRMIVTAAHEMADLDWAMDRLAEVGKEFDLIP